MQVDPERLMAHILELSQSPRPAGSAALETARAYVADQFRLAGWAVEDHGFEAVTEYGERLRGVNVIARFTDSLLRLPSESRRARLCVGAHVDSKPNSPGADDNASAVAALLEIARILPQAWPENPMLDLELVGFDLEELGMLGGAEHAALLKAQAVDLRGMVSFEMLGYCDDTPNSQSLPRPLVGLYPDTGDFIAVIGNQNSGPLIEAFSAGMRRVDRLPVETLAVPSNGDYLQATRLSDHSPFWDAGYPALMITDTSFLRNPHYHRPSDTPETLDLPFLHRVTEGCLEAVRQIIRNGLGQTADQAGPEHGD